ncbi:type II toxin-antitoxin system RelE/ParE family toxin [Pararhizobium sp.]|uniref:type II toxin-antitoxin system RelE/ParE family toxin n=1 Tax=Pararhizobium sp. TaxID=1977563 RepID=UPI002724F245|nr:type II toxin-antitoxin system RelE/ParE family toxin [Pararhizobium sp.]MDO9418692.1 type II toxin-antitoxin system RelE/ParE family toxin [Pararhizobium sp.]
MKPYIVTPKARSDLRQIGRYTSVQWGVPQRNTYLRALTERFAWIADNPMLGKKRPDIHPVYMCFAEGEHLIFYIVLDQTVMIIGLPHKRMDIGRYFQA